MNEIEADLAAIKARAAPLLVQYRHLTRILTSAAAVIVTAVAIGVFFYVAEQSLAKQDKINQELTWTR